MVKKDLTGLFIGISVLLFALDFLGMLRFLKNPLEYAAKELQKSVYSANIMVQNAGSFVSQYPRLKSMFEGYDHLRKSNEELQLKIAVLTQENTKLRSQMDARLPSQYQLNPATVVGVSQYMTLDAGEKSGVVPGMTVVDGNSLVGKVAKVTKLRSIVLLPTDGQLTIPVKTSRGTKGIVIGQFGKSIQLDKVLQKEALFLDDQVVTSGDDGFPPNLLIGKIVHINADDASPYKQAKVEPIIDYQKEQTVFVITSQ